MALRQRQEWRVEPRPQELRGWLRTEKSPRARKLRGLHGFGLWGEREQHTAHAHFKAVAEMQDRKVADCDEVGGPPGSGWAWAPVGLVGCLAGTGPKVGVA